MSPGYKLLPYLAVAMLLCFPQGAASAEEAAAPAESRAVAIEKVIALGINDAVARALEANLDIVVERYNKDIREAELLSAEGIFDPTIRLELSYEEGEIPQTTREGLASQAGTAETVSKDLAFTVEGKLPPGTEYGVTFDREQSQFTQRDTFVGPGPTDFADVRNPSEYNLDLTFTLTQPLLKNFGPRANLAGIRVARGERDMSAEDFQKRVMDVVAEAQSAYWDLVAAIENLRVSEESLNLAQDLLAENRIRLEVGTMARLEVLQAETGAAQREEEVIVARSLIEGAEDNLKRILNLPKDTEEWKTRIRPTDVPEFVERQIDLLAQLETAFEKRPDYKRSLMQIENDAIDEQFARNQLLPTVDVNGQYQFLAVDGEFHSAFDDIERGSSPSWQLGLTAEYPIRNRTAKGEYRKAQLEKRQSEKESENLRLSIIVEVNKAVRDIRTSMKRIEVTAKAVALAEESLKAERKKLEVGVSTSHDVLEFEEEAVDAQRRGILAKLDYAKALIDLAGATGTVLEENNIVIEESY
jgi:outer membrane protein TolC